MSDIRRWLDDAGPARSRDRLDASHACQATGPEDEPARAPGRLGRLQLALGDPDRTGCHLEEELAIDEGLGAVAPESACAIAR